MFKFPPESRLTLDGQDISNKVRSATLTFKPGSIVSLTIEVDVLFAEVRPDGMIVAKTYDFAATEKQATETDAQPDR